MFRKKRNQNYFEMKKQKTNENQNLVLNFYYLP